MLEAEVVVPTNLQVNRQSEPAPLSELTAIHARFGKFMSVAILVWQELPQVWVSSIAASVVSQRDGVNRILSFLTIAIGERE
jgi:hypothetical protein